MTKPQLVVDILNLPDVTDDDCIEMVTLRQICDKISEGNPVNAVSALADCSPVELQMMFNVHMWILLQSSVTGKRNALEVSGSCISDILAATLIQATAEEMVK